MGDDNVLVNLRVLARLQEGDRVNCSSRYFEIESGAFTMLWRWLRQETREKSLSSIADVMARAALVPGAHVFAAQAREGLRKLKITYASCSTTVARLDHIMTTSEAACCACAAEPARRPRPAASPAPASASAETQTGSCSPSQEHERSF